MAMISKDIQDLYSRQFGKKPVVPELTEPALEVSDVRIEANQRNTVTTTGSSLTAEFRGQEIWLPVKFFELDTAVFGVSEILLPYAVIKISGEKTLIKTPMAEMQGSVLEQYSINDFEINIKGFLLGYDASGKYPIWPEDEMRILKELYFQNTSVKLDNAKTNVLIGQESRVVIRSIDFPEVEGGRKNFIPFTMRLESDTIFTLEIE
jgi:hypothetical protein